MFVGVGGIFISINHTVHRVIYYAKNLPKAKKNLVKFYRKTIKRLKVKSLAYLKSVKNINQTVEILMLYPAA